MNTIKINKKQYLDEVVPELLTNTIYFKTLTGIGATTLEINTKRNSIVLEVNVPVIIGKRKTGVLSVYEKVGVDAVIQYLTSDIKYKKILVTPESFWKITYAASRLDIDLEKEFFLLFDECDRTIKDVGYRPKILAPMDTFFKFDNKAFISATAIQPSDPRFGEQGFERVDIVANYKVEKNINLVATNNIFLSLKQTLASIEHENICIFVNSTNLIGSVIKTLNINNESVVHCSRESAHQLSISGIKKVSDQLSTFKKYNFFTSRFFSAVDIIMDIPPVVIILTDFKVASHSIIDPYCDTTQIVGRFRKGHKEVFHISNFDPDMTSMNKEEVLAYLNGCENSYNDIKALKASTLNQGAIDTLNSALKLVPFANFLNPDGSKNYFMVDNMVLEEKVKHTYLSTDNFKADYEGYGYSCTYQEQFYPMSDRTVLKVRSGISTIDVVRNIIDAVNAIKNPEEVYSITNRETVMQELNRSHPIIMEGLNVLGAEGLLRNGYSQKQIKKATLAKKTKGDFENFAFLRYLQSNIVDGTSYTALQLSRIFENGVKDHNLTLKPRLSNIKEIFNLKRTTVRENGKEEKVYVVVNCKLNR